MRQGFAVATIYYKDVTGDDGDFTNGLAGVLFGGKERNEHDPGKIMMWAWAAMRAADYLQTLDSADLESLAVIGHSRLGKTALVAAAFDERFRFVHSNNSGCSGAAIIRGKTGEQIDDICRNFPSGSAKTTKLTERTKAPCHLTSTCFLPSQPPDSFPSAARRRIYGLTPLPNFSHAPPRPPFTPFTEKRVLLPPTPFRPKRAHIKSAA